jgi:hypothetical protein
MKKKIVAGILLSQIVLSMFALDTAVSATTTCPTPPIVLFSGNGGVIESQLNYEKKLVPSSTWTDACKKKAIAYYQIQYTAWVKKNGGQAITDFSKRITICMGNTNLTVLNVGSWVLSLRCLFTTSFFPQAEGFKEQFNNLKDSVNTHQPISYIPVAYKVFSGVVSNWGTDPCNAGDLDFKVRFVGMTTDQTFAIPCSPPAPLVPLRKLLILVVWLMFIWFVYNNATAFLRSTL